MATIKIKIPAQTVSVNADDWALAYGIDRKNVRADVKAYFECQAQEQIDGLELNNEISIEEMKNGVR